MLNKNKKFLVLSIIFVILGLGINVFIIYQSCLPAGDSTEWSSPVVEIAASIVNAFSPEAITESNMPEFSSVIRKLIGHFGLFGLNGVLTTLALFFSTCEEKFYTTKHGIFLSLAFGFTIASLTEIIQLVTPGRSGEFTDVLIDFSGYLVAFFIVFLILKLVKRKAK